MLGCQMMVMFGLDYLGVVGDVVLAKVSSILFGNFESKV